MGTARRSSIASRSLACLGLPGCFGFAELTTTLVLTRHGILLAALESVTAVLQRKRRHCPLWTVRRNPCPALPNRRLGRSRRRVCTNRAPRGAGGAQVSGLVRRPPSRLGALPRERATEVFAGRGSPRCVRRDRNLTAPIRQRSMSASRALAMTTFLGNGRTTQRERHERCYAGGRRPSRTCCEARGGILHGPHSQPSNGAAGVLSACCW
jgi:hypothetical protein